MAADDFNTFVAKQRYQQLEANKAQCLADLARARADADYAAGTAAVAELEEIESKQRNTVRMHDEYIRSQTPVQAPELTAEERHAKPWDKMDYGDIWEISQNAKHGVDENLFRAGIAEVARRRARGE